MKIENKISRILEIALLSIVIVVTVMFFAGGKMEGSKEYVYTNLLLFSTYILVAVTLLVTFVLSLINFVKNVIHDPKSSVKSLAGILGIIVVVYISYLFADSTPLYLPGYDGNSNEGGWLIVSDMCLFTTYFMIAITALSTFVTAIIKALR